MKATRRLTRTATKRVAISAVASIAIFAGLGTVISTPASAGSLAPILCGKSTYVNEDMSPIHSYSSGGYVGEGCGAGIDYAATPTYSNEWYTFGTTDGGTYPIQAWVPTVYATATMDYTLYACGNQIADVTINQSYYNGWVSIFTLSGYSGCKIQINAWTGMASSGAYIGFDAIRTHL